MTTPSSAYEQRIARVCDYIQQNLNGELTPERLSEIAAFSQFHFQRIFAAYAGITLARFIQQVRLKRASYRLAFEPDKRIIDIALEAGFESPEAFSRAFKRTLGQSPSEFRSNPDWAEWHLRVQTHVPNTGVPPMEIKVVYFEPAKVAMLEHLGSPETVLETAGKFIAWRKETGLSPVKSSRTYGIPYSDPKLTEPQSFRWDVCGTVEDDVPPNRFGVKTGTIPGGRCAVFRHRGSLESVDVGIYYVYREWLPNNGEEVRDFPCFFHYLNFIHEVDECDLLTDVYVPLK